MNAKYKQNTVIMRLDDSIMELGGGSAGGDRFFLLMTIDCYREYGWCRETINPPGPLYKGGGEEALLSKSRQLKNPLPRK